MSDENKELQPAEEKNDQTEQPAKRISGGLYRNVKMSVKTANILVTVIIVAMVIAMIYITNHTGFTISFDTNGGSHVESIKLMHGDKIPSDIEDPVKEGYEFTGWYYDRDCTGKWDMENDVVTTSFTLYAGWKEAPK